MTEKAVKDFWKKWQDADELKRLDLIKTLTGMKEHSTASLTNAYLCDLEEYLEEKQND